MSRVDVIVPCYNYARYLPTCVESILNQSLKDLRVLIVDDASTDESETVAAGLASRDERVTFRRHVSNQGNVATYNEGLEWASAEYLLLLSADDWLTSGSLARAVHVLDTFPDVVLTCGKAIVADGESLNPEVSDQKDECSYHITSGLEFIEKACMNSTTSPIWTPTAVVRTSAQKKIGGYNPSLPHACDLEMWLRFACHGSIATLNAFQAYYRKHESNMHYAFVKKTLDNSQQHFSAFETVFWTHGDKIVDKEKLQRLYRSVIARESLESAARAHEIGSLTECKENMAFAETVYPEICSTLPWYRMLVKTKLGPALVARIRTLKHFVQSQRRRALM